MTEHISTATVIRAQEQPLAQWRGGTTRAIYAHPNAALTQLATAHAWVGTATIERDGPYSVFVERTRIHMPIRGNGLTLHFREPEETRHLHNLAQATFPGDRPLDVSLIDGPVEAFNVIAHPSVQVTVQPVPITAGSFMLPLSTGCVNILYLAEGRCFMGWASAENAILSRGDALIYPSREEGRLACQGSHATLIHAMLALPAVPTRAKYS